MTVKTRPAILAVLLGAAMASPASAQLSEASSADVADAVSTCMTAVSHDDIDEIRLSAEGWEKATITSSGDAGPPGLEMYSNQDNEALLVTNVDDGSALCVALAKIGSPSEYQSIVDAIDALEGVSPAIQEEFKIIFSTGDRIIQSDITGTPADLGVRISVAAMDSEK